MNYLAHIYLSGENELIQIGNFIADQLKGVDKSMFHPDIQKGILLHKHIDSYTDSHPRVHQTKKRLHPTVGKYAPVVSDLYYDHFLAIQWQQYHHQPLLHYTQQFYDLLHQHKAILPERTRYILNYIEPNNWLYNYQYIDGMQNVFRGMSRRARFDNNMEHATNYLVADYAEYEQDFNSFFPDLIVSCKQFCLTNSF